MLKNLRELYAAISPVNKLILKLTLAAALFFVAMTACANEVEVKEQQKVQYLVVCTQLGIMAEHEDVSRFQGLLFPYASSDDWKVFLAYHIGKTEGSILTLAQVDGVPVQFVAGKLFDKVCLRSPL